MALIISVGSGATVATDIVASNHYGFNKIVDGTAGSVNPLVVDAGGSAQTALKGNVTLANSKNFIGLVTVGNTVAVTGTFFQASQPVSIGGNVTLDPGSLTGITGNVTIDSGVITTITNPVALKGNLTLTDSKGFIGLVTVGNTVATTFKGNVTLDAGSLTGINGNVTIDSGVITTITNPIALKGNLTLSDPKGYIGLVTVTQASSARTITGNLSISSQVAWPDPKSYIGLVTITGALSAAAGNITLDGGSLTGIVGNVTIDSGVITSITNPIAIAGNVTLSNSKNFIGLVTVGNIVSTTFAGNVTLDAGSKTGLVGTVTIQDGGNSITVDGNVGITGNVSISSNIAWPDPKTYIGLVTITGALSAAAGNITLDAGSKTGLVGNITIDSGVITTITNPVALKGNLTITDSKGFLGLTTAVIGSNVAWADPKGYIGLVTITGSLAAAAGNITLDAGSKTGLVGTVTIQDGGNSITIDGNVGTIGNITIDSGVITTITNPVALKGNLTLSDSKGFIGLVTAVLSSTTRSIIGNLTIDSGRISLVGNVTIQDGGNTISTDIIGNVTISDSKGFIGLTTAISLNAGTTKTLVNAPISFLSAGSQATIAVPTNAQQIYITNMLLNSDATVRVSIKSGVTYLSGNASVGITLNPAGGFIMSGSVDSPTWVGLPSGALIIEKLDLTGTSAKIGGNVMYYSQ